MACTGSSLRCRNNSEELDVFEATRYFSGYTDVVQVTSHPGPRNGGVTNPYGSCGSLSDKETREEPCSRVARESIHGAIVRGDQGRVSKDKILKQPSSPGGKMVNFMKSLFNPSSSAGGVRESKVRKTSVTGSLKNREETNPCEWRRRRRRSSSLGHLWTSSAVSDSKLETSINGTVSSFPLVHSGSRTPPHRLAAVSVSIRNVAREELAKWEASYAAKEASNPSHIVVDCDDDDGDESDSSSDLFELPV